MGLFLDLLELVVCGVPLFLWMKRIPWGETWLKVAAPLTLALWILSAFHLALHLRPILSFLGAFGAGRNPKLPDPARTKEVLARIPREAGMIHFGGWLFVTLSLVWGGYFRSGVGDPFLLAGLSQLILSSAAGLAASRALAFEVLLNPVRPVLLPNLQGVRLFADRWRGMMLALGVATVGLTQALLALYLPGFVAIDGRALSVGAFLWWPLTLGFALWWWKSLSAWSSPLSNYLQLALTVKGNKGIPRDEPKAVDAYVATQGLAYRLSFVLGPGMLVAGLVGFSFAHRSGFFAWGRGALVILVVTLMATLYQSLLMQHLLRPIMRHLGSRHYLPLAKVRAPLGLAPKLIITMVSTLGMVGIIAWLSLSNTSHLPVPGVCPFLLTVLLLLGIVLLVVRDIVAPLHALEERSGEMATGQLARPVPPWGEANEIGRLALAFEEMRRSLRDRLRSTESINVDLEREVRRRTEALEQRNAELHEALDKLRRAQDNLVRSEKLASMGRLVAGIAHEINNPVNAVINSLGPLEEAIARLKDNCSHPEVAQAVEEAMEILAVVQRGSARTKAIVQSLHGYARGDEKTQREVLLARSVEDTVGLLSHRLRHVKVDRQVPADVRILGFPGQIDQVLMNLLTNAAQAMGDKGGTIKILAENQDAHVLLSVEDDGMGIPADILNHIFDPFFTTKDVGEGSGLGLSIVHGIVDRHGGKIEVHSEVGKGTKFSIFFPLPGVTKRQV